MSCDGDEDELLTKWTDICLRGMSETTGVQQTESKNRVQAGEENLVVNNVKSGRKIQQKKNRNVVIVQSGKNIV